MNLKTIKFCVIKMCAVVLFGVASGSTLATVHTISDSNFSMLDPSGSVVGGIVNDVFGTFDDSMLCNSESCTLSGSMALATNTRWFGFIPVWHDIRVFTEGVYTFDTNCTGADIAAGITNCGGDTLLTLIVEPGQVGMHGLFDWAETEDMDVAVVWDFFKPFPTTGTEIWNLASQDGNGDGVPGIPMVDGVFPSLSANFNLDMDPLFGESGVAVSIDVIGGAIQLCLDPSGCAVTFIADTTLAGNADLGIIEWTVDGTFGGYGEEISPVLALGLHTVEVLATTTTGESDTDTSTVTLVDRILPTPLPDGTRLSIDAGSYFQVVGGPTFLNEGADGLVLGEVVPALPESFHPGLPDGNEDELGGIVESYELLGNTGTFWTESPIKDLGGGLIEMVGWRAAWDVWPSVGFDNPEGLFTVVGDSYELDYSALATGGPFPGISYILHLEGKVQLTNQAPDCTQAVASTDLLWPPNHKFAPVSVLGVTDSDGDTVTITVDSIFQDEPTDSFGDGRFSPDGAGIGTSTAELRAERSGTKKVPGNGRVYHIGYTADDGQGGSCSGEVTVAVPHDQNAPPVDDGALFDSTIL